MTPTSPKSTYLQTSKSSRPLKRVFSGISRDPFASVPWTKRNCEIRDAHGGVVFHLQSVETPQGWSDSACTIVAAKYLQRGAGRGRGETSIRSLLARVVDTITAWGTRDRYFAGTSAIVFRDELLHILLHQMASFNSPVWFNVGIHKIPQTSACFILSVGDSLDSLLELQATEARIFKFGSGCGSNLSSIRSNSEPLARGGFPSGPVSFMRGFDAWAGVIKSGGTSRRAAKMQILNVTHPDILEFIAAKAAEEKRARILIGAGYPSSLGVKDSAYESVAFQNSNFSVRVSDAFMRLALNGRGYYTKRVTDGRTHEKLNASHVLEKIAEAAHACGDPGMQFDSTINRWNTCVSSGRINASNPCGEYMHLDDSACNLASINLLPFLRTNNSFDGEGFCQAISILVRALDVMIDRSSFPTRAIAANAKNFRQLGIGYTNLGSLLMCLGLPYDSEQARAWTAAITALMSAEAYRTSALLAREKGAFRGFRDNKMAMLQVIRRHRSACRHLAATHPLAASARNLWDQAQKIGEKYGFRNAQTTLIAPTGTISFMMDCDTTGIEPELALVKYKKLVGGGSLKIVNKSVGRALTTLGYPGEERDQIIRYVQENERVEGAPYLRPEHLAVFDCAFPAPGCTRYISPGGHLSMMAVAQPFLSGAISKTVNLPPHVSVREVREIFIQAWQFGLKAVAIYRAGSKQAEPLKPTPGCPDCGNLLPTSLGACFLCPHCGAQWGCG